MALQFNEEEINNFESSTKFTQKLETLKSQLPAILADFKKYYIFFNKNPEYPEYEQMLNDINSQLFILSNDLQINTDKINEKLFALDVLIRKEKKKNRELKLKLGIIEHKNSAASELIYDYKEMYESDYLRNWALFLSIVVVGLTISKTFKSV